MTTKEYLSQISRLESLINSKKHRVDALRHLATNIQSPKITDMPKNTNKSLSPMADAICKALDLEEEIRKDEILLQQKKLFLLERIGTLEDVDCQTLLIKRYFEKQSWDDIALSMFYTKRWIYKLRGKALLELDAEFASTTNIP